MHPLDFWRYVTRYQSRPTTPPYEGEVRPVTTKLCSEEEARQKLEEFFDRYEKGGGADLRVELVRGLLGIRFTLVGDWDDMG